MAKNKGDFVTVENLQSILESTLSRIIDEKFEEKLKGYSEIIKENKELKAKIAKLEKKADDTDKYLRRNNVVVSGIPYHVGENAMEVAMSAGELVGVQLSPQDIDIAHRLRSRKEPKAKDRKFPPPFVIKLVHRHKKIELIKQAKQIKPTAESMGGPKKTKVFYNEHLIQANQEIVTAARKIGKRISVWTWNGEVFCQGKEEGCSILKLDSMKDVNDLKEMYGTEEDEVNGFNGGSNGATGSRVPYTPSKKRTAAELRPIFDELNRKKIDNDTRNGQSTHAEESI